MTAVLFAALVVATAGWLSTGLHRSQERRWRMDAEDEMRRALADLNDAAQLRLTTNPTTKDVTHGCR